VAFAPNASFTQKWGDPWLVLSVYTVARHVSNIFDKTGVVNRTEAATYAARHRLVE
jgi:DNA-binding NarL/FixJ family response regulator